MMTNAARGAMKKRYKKEMSSQQLAALSDEGIDASDIPELGKNFWEHARVVMPEDRNEPK